MTDGNQASHHSAHGIRAVKRDEASVAAVRAVAFALAFVSFFYFLVVVFILMPPDGDTKAHQAINT